LSLAYGAQNTVLLSGQVTSHVPGSVTVTFTGVVSGSILTNPTAVSSVTTGGVGLGTIQGVAVDSLGTPSIRSR